MTPPLRPPPCTPTRPLRALTIAGVALLFGSGCGKPSTAGDSTTTTPTSATSPASIAGTPITGTPITGTPITGTPITGTPGTTHGGDAEPGSPGSGDTLPADDAATTPDPPAIDWNDGTDVPFDPRAVDPRPVPVDLLRTGPHGDTVQVMWWGGVCDRVAAGRAEVTAAEVRVDLRVGRDPTASVCVEMARLNRVEIRLSTAVADRRLVDINAG